MPLLLVLVVDVLDAVLLLFPVVLVPAPAVEAFPPPWRRRKP